MNYNIKWGDTLSGLAQKFGTSVDSLMKSNPQIKNRDLIYAGANLNVPGKKDDFQGPGSTGSGERRAGGPGNRTGGTDAPAGSDGGTSSGGASDAYRIAQSHLGKNAGSLKLENSAVGRSMQDWVPNNVNCANFVSGCLVAAGQIEQGQSSASVMQLMGNLDRDSDFKRVSLADAKPGDVVSMKTPGGQHVVMFSGWKNGQPQFIGSNNINSDGSQRISYSGFNYPIMAIHQYRG